MYNGTLKKIPRGKDAPLTDLSKHCTVYKAVVFSYY